MGYAHSSQGKAVTALPHLVRSRNKVWSRNSVRNPHSNWAVVTVFNFYVHNASGFMLAISQSWLKMASKVHFVKNTWIRDGIGGAGEGKINGKRVREGKIHLLKEKCKKQRRKETKLKMRVTRQWFKVTTAVFDVHGAVHRNIFL